MQMSQADAINELHALLESGRRSPAAAVGAMARAQVLLNILERKMGGEPDYVQWVTHATVESLTIAAVGGAHTQTGDLVFNFTEPGTVVGIKSTVSEGHDFTSRVACYLRLNGRSIGATNGNADAPLPLVFISGASKPIGAQVSPMTFRVKPGDRATIRYLTLLPLQATAQVLTPVTAFALVRDDR